MDKITIYKADPITNDKPVDDFEIHIKKQIPDTQEFANLKAVEEFYKTDALDLFYALRNHLPQGTRHQLLILLLKDTENLYRGI